LITSNDYRKRLKVIMPGTVEDLRAVLTDLGKSENVFLHLLPTSLSQSSFVEYQLVVLDRNMQNCGIYSLTQLPNNKTLLIIDPRPWPYRFRILTPEEQESFNKFTEKLLQRLIELGFLTQAAYRKIVYRSDLP